MTKDLRLTTFDLIVHEKSNWPVIIFAVSNCRFRPKAGTAVSAVYRYRT